MTKSEQMKTRVMVFGEPTMSSAMRLLGLLSERNVQHGDEPERLPKLIEEDISQNVLNQKSIL